MVPNNNDNIRATKPLSGVKGYMMDKIFFILACLLAYLIGSIPLGFLIAKARGIDIRHVGSVSAQMLKIYIQKSQGCVLHPN